MAKLLLEALPVAPAPDVRPSVAVEGLLQGALPCPAVCGLLQGGLAL